MATPFAVRLDPADTLQTEPVSIRVEGCRPGERLRLASRLLDDLGVAWTAHGDHVADASGTVDTASAPSEGGTYVGLEPAGLLWSLQPPGGTGRQFLMNATERAHKLGLPACDPVKPLRIEIAAERPDGSRATAELCLRRLAPGIEVQPLRDGRLRGTVFRWTDRSRSRGAIVSLTGSGGGVEMGYAPLLASLGYDVVSLAYFNHEDLSPMLANIPLEYFAEGFEWLRRELGARRIAVQGASRGGELTLVLAAHFPEYVNGGVAIVPMYATSPGWNHATGEITASWTLNGAPIPYVTGRATPPDEIRRIADLQPHGYPMADDFRVALEPLEVRERAAIPVERVSGPLLLISGVEDQMWHCEWGSDVVVNRLRAKGFAHPVRHLALPETGHITPLPNTVTSFAPSVYHSLAHMLLACGGTPRGAARASWTMWQAMKDHYRLVFGG
ncbi:MAG: alpha/beta fold hydrolase [Steroidobacteraceae bacterium]|jgi:pimeloyl-ACP methyl ester carboxylesterase|nr:alpha/beta fold hydrolase [Steroidobacteraceae bacterium]